MNIESLLKTNAQIVQASKLGMHTAVSLQMTRAVMPHCSR